MFIPLKVDVPMSRLPWVNITLIAVTAFVSVTAFYDKWLLYEFGGSRPSRTSRSDGGVSVELSTKYYPLPVLAMTSTLVHAGWLHLLGNMLFLWVFGNAVNHKFGQVGYLGLYAAAAVAGGLMHYATSNLPCIGASGAINGVMGAFLVFFPRNDVTVVWFLLVYPRTTRVSSIWMIVFWVAWDVLFLVVGATIGVALWAHVAGFAAGFGIALLCAAVGWIKPSQSEQTLLQIFGR